MFYTAPVRKDGISMAPQGTFGPVGQFSILVPRSDKRQLRHITTPTKAVKNVKIHCRIASVVPLVTVTICFKYDLIFVSWTARPGMRILVLSGQYWAVLKRSPVRITRSSARIMIRWARLWFGRLI